MLLRFMNPLANLKVLLPLGLDGTGCYWAGMTCMEKCGISGLKDAGNCFAMAECWTHAAKAYAKGKCFAECLSVCSKGGMFDTGLRIIEQWREASCFFLGSW